MTNFKRVLSCALALVLAIACLTSCGGGNYAMKIGDETISVSEYTERFLQGKNYYDQVAGDVDWEDNGEGSMLYNLVSQVEQQFKQQVVFNQMYKEYKISLTSEDKAAAEAQIAQTVESLGGEEEFEKQLALSNYTKESYTDLILQNQLVVKLISHFSLNEDGTEMTDEQAEAYLIENSPRVKHVLISNEGEVDGDKRALAEDVLAKAKAGEDFDALVAQYGEDPGMESQPDGYILSRGQMVPEFEEASYALGIDEISDIVETTYGYHIIKRYALDPDYVKNNIETTKHNIGSTILQEQLSQRVATLEVVKGEGYDAMIEKIIKDNPAPVAEPAEDEAIGGADTQTDIVVE